MAGIGDTPMNRFLADLRAGAFGPNDVPAPDYLEQVAATATAARGTTTP